MNLRERKIGIVGAPRSGNRIIAHMLQHHGLVAEVRHYGSKKPFRNGGWAEVVIWPIRDYEYWRLSCTRDLVILPKPLGVLGDLKVEDLWRIHHDFTQRTLTELAPIPCLPVLYEEIVKRPDLVGRRLLSFAAAPEPMPKWKGWGAEIIDGNRKHYGCNYARLHVHDPIPEPTAEDLAELERMRQPGGVLDPAKLRP